MNFEGEKDIFVKLVQKRREMGDRKQEKEKIWRARQDMLVLTMKGRKN